MGAALETPVTAAAPRGRNRETEVQGWDGDYFSPYIFLNSMDFFFFTMCMSSSIPKKILANNKHLIIKRRK